MTGLDELRDALLGVLPNVAHGHGYKMDPPYLIWMEEGIRDHMADNEIQDQIAFGTVGLYYPPEDENLVSCVHSALMSVGFGELTDNHYADELGLNEALWRFEVVL